MESGLSPEFASLVSEVGWCLFYFINAIQYATKLDLSLISSSMFDVSLYPNISAAPKVHCDTRIRYHYIISN